MIDPATVKLGKGRAYIDPLVPRMRSVLNSDVPPAPATCDWTHGHLAFGMMENDTLGDCTAAGIGHLYQIWTANAYSREWDPSDEQVVDFYSKSTGYVAGDPSTDNGGVEADVLAYLQKNGFCKRRIVGHARVSWKDQSEAKQGIFVGGGLYLGVALPLAAQTQEIWDVGGILQTFNSAYKPGSWGLHCLVAVGYDAQFVYFVTWGKVQKATWPWFAKYVDEAWLIVAGAWINNEMSPNGINQAALTAWMNHLGTAQ